LASLKKLSFLKNNIETLPRSIGRLIDLDYLDLRMNKFNHLPGSIWSLRNLKELLLDNNPWTQEAKYIIEKQDLPLLLEKCRQNATLNIFLSHAVADYDYFKIDQISKLLEQQNEIYRAFYCEQDLTGNIDDFMNEKVPECQILLFFASQKSLFNSVDCAHELDLARQHEIQIIPIKGLDVSWEDLDKLRLSRELGHEFLPDDYDEFVEDIIIYIKKLKRNVNLFDTKEAKIDRERINLKNTISHLINSKDFRTKIFNSIDGLKELFEDLNAKKITAMDYFTKSARILSKNKSE
jgi:Leucine-rich repeat (LRR) protein